MNGKERIAAILAHEIPDRVGVFEHFWPETLKLWRHQGYLEPDESPEDHFDLDMQNSWIFNFMADLDRSETILEETEQTKLVRTGNGAILRYWKNKSGTPEHVDFEIKDRSGWERDIKPKLLDESRFDDRIDLTKYRTDIAAAARRGAFFCLSGTNVFERVHPVCGHETMLMSMALEPDWVRDMCEVYSDLLIAFLARVFDAAGKPDGVWFYEDMGFKEKPFMSPSMYRDIIWPAHKKTFDFVHSHGLPVFVHSCGCVEKLVPDMIAAGMDCLQAMEVKAGMDLLRIKQSYGDRIALCGGLDIRVLETNDPEAVTAYLEQMLVPAMRDGRYILHTDHSIPNSVAYQTYRHFLETGKRIGHYHQQASYMGENSGTLH